MIHPATELRFIDDAIGYGVFTTAFIPAGTIIWALDAFDRILSPDEVRALPDLLRAQLEKYAYVDAAGDFILCWDFGRYMNHSCRPTSRSVGEAFEIAIRDIQPGEQLTCEYGTLNMTGDFACACGAPGCRGSVSAADLETLWPEWDREAAQAFQRALSVPQPLLPYAKLSPADRALADALREGREVPLPSSRAYQAPERARPESGDGLWALGR
ncbi:SET domain-containing protein [bacterium]|nr:SET domain-containing protein [bacterium]